MLTIDLVATSEPAPPHVYDRGKIMRRAWEIARKTRAERARKACDLQTHVVGSRIIPAKNYKDVLAETPIDLAAALNSRGLRPSATMRIRRNRPRRCCSLKPTGAMTSSKAGR